MLAGLLWAWAGLGAAALVLRWVDLAGPVPVLQAGIPYAGASLLVLLAVAALARRARVVLVTAVLLVPYLLLAAPWWTGDPRPHRDGDLVVLSANLRYGHADWDRLVQAVIHTGADAVVLLEVTPAALEALDAGPLPELLPHRARTGPEHVLATLVLTADPHTELTEDPPGLVDGVPVQVHSPQGEWRLMGAHPGSPALSGSRRWWFDLRGVSEWVARQPPEVPLVVAGDLNSSHDHPAFRRVADGMQDVHRQVGAGWVRTWPVGTRVPPLVHLDHVLVRHLQVVDAGTEELPGSDHLAVWARLRLP